MALTSYQYKQIFYPCASRQSGLSLNSHYVVQSKMTFSLKESVKTHSPINLLIEETSVSGDFWQGQPESLRLSHS
jgi:hypothetical protein